MRYIILILWTFSLFLLMFSSFPFRVECRPTRAMGPGPPQQVPGPHLSLIGHPQQTLCPVVEGPDWPEYYRTDITAKVWDSPIVLEGTARSRSEVKPDGTFGVTFDLHRVVKGDAPLLRRRKQFRLQFLDNPNPLPDPRDAPRRKSINIYRNNKSNNNNFNNATTLISPPTRSRSSNFNQVLSSKSNNVNPRTITPAAPPTTRSSLATKQLQLYHQRQQQRQQQQQPVMQQTPRSNSYPYQLQPQSQQSQFRQQSQSPSFSRPISRNSSIVPGSYQYPNLRTSSSLSSSSSSSTRPYSYPYPYPYPTPVRNTSVSLPISSSSSRSSGSRRGRSVPISFGKSTLASSPKCLPPKATVKTGRRYYVFAAKVENHFIAVFSPELVNKRNIKGAEGVLCKGCGQAPSVVTAKEVSLVVKERLRIRCKLRAGNPIPILTWYKDGRPLNFTDPRFRLRTKRRQSILVIRKGREADVGVYRCEARNGFGSAYSSVRVSLAPKSALSAPPKPKPVTPRPFSKPGVSSAKPVGTTPTTLWPLESRDCPFDSYCLNGGTCTYYETIGEFVCQCAEGYKGQRCDTKDISRSGSTYLSYFCIFGTNNPDYPC